MTTKSPPGDPTKVIPLLMPRSTNSMEEGTVVSWLVEVGEEIEVGDVLCELETDKAVVDYESPDAGRVARIVAEEETTLEVGAPIAYLAPSDADLEAYLARVPAAEASPEDASEAAASAAQPAAGATGAPDGERRVSPAARRIAAERGIDLASVGAGSGPRGRVLSTDLPDTPGVRRRPLSKMRRAIAATLVEAKRTIPHFYCRTTIDAAPMLAFRERHREATGCSINDVITLACSRVIAEMPLFRSRLDGADLLEHPHADVGIAVGLDEGLVVPVLLEADTLPIAEIAARSKELVRRAREGRVDNMGRGVFTISNLGMFDIDEFTAIVNPPESAILAVGAVRETMIVKDGEARPGRVVRMTLSSDHRLIDGIVGARFLTRLRELLEAPEEHLEEA